VRPPGAHVSCGVWLGAWTWCGWDASTAVPLHQPVHLLPFAKKAMPHSQRRTRRCPRRRAARGGGGRGRAGAAARRVRVCAGRAARRRGRRPAGAPLRCARLRRSPTGRQRRRPRGRAADCTGAASPSGAGGSSARSDMRGGLLSSRAAPVCWCGPPRARISLPAARARSSRSWTPRSASWPRRARPRPRWRPRRPRWRPSRPRGRPSATRCRQIRCGGRQAALCAVRVPTSALTLCAAASCIEGRQGGCRLIARAAAARSGRGAGGRA